MPSAFSLRLLQYSRATPALFYSRRKNRLEMGTLFFARNNRDFDVLEAAGFEKLMELHFAKPEPMIGVELAGAFEAVAEQI
jgi:hypothetical protein